jgi:hypothetical protein
MKTPILTRNAFEAWLAEFPDEASVGCVGDGKDCPIARYIHPRGMPSAFVDNERIFPDGKISSDRNIRLPEWAETFTYAVDEQEAGTINAGTAREILSHISDEGVRL